MSGLIDNMNYLPRIYAMSPESDRIDEDKKKDELWTHETEIL